MNIRKENEIEDVDIDELNDSLELRAKKENDLRLGIKGFIENIEDDEKNTIKKLLEQYNKDGVEEMPLFELLDYEQPTKYIVESTVYLKYSDNS